VLHAASHQINVGDGALIMGMRGALARVASTPVAFTDAEVVDFVGDLSALQGENFGQRHDLILVGGGGAISGGRNFAASGMACPLGGNDIRRLRPPLAYVALGYNLFPGQPFFHKKSLIDVLRATAELEIPFSVRNDGSLERLQELAGLAADHVVEVPDPGFFVTADPDYHVPQFQGERRRVVLQVAGDNLEHRLALAERGRDFRWRRKPEKRRRRAFIDDMARLVRWLVEKQHAQVVLAPHITRDLTITAEILERAPNAIVRPHVRVLGVPHPKSAAQFFAAYARADLVIGMRGHSVICAVGLGTPCLAISTHDKVAGFMRKCGLSDWTVAWTRDFYERMQAAASELLERPEKQLAARAASTAGFGARFDQFMGRCWRKRRTRAAAA